MITINIAVDFTTEPGARTYSDGQFSGQEFFDELLLPKYEEAISKNDKLTIILDGTEGFASSFINEAFRRLGERFKPDEIWSNLVLISNEVPKYITRVKEALYENRK